MFTEDPQFCDDGALNVIMLHICLCVTINFPGSARYIFFSFPCFAFKTVRLVSVTSHCTWVVSLTLVIHVVGQLFFSILLLCNSAFFTVPTLFSWHVAFYFACRKDYSASSGPCLKIKRNDFTMQQVNFLSIVPLLYLCCTETSPSLQPSKESFTVRGGLSTGNLEIHQLPPPSNFWFRPPLQCLSRILLLRLPGRYCRTVIFPWHIPWSASAFNPPQSPWPWSCGICSSTNSAKHWGHWGETAFVKEARPKLSSSTLKVPRDSAARMEKNARS